MTYKVTGLVAVYSQAACRHFSLQKAAWWFLTESWNV